MGVRAGIGRAGAGVLVVAAALAVSGSSGAAAVRPALLPFRGLGTWVDIDDTDLRADPEAAVAAMSANGVRTLYLETSNLPRRRADRGAEHRRPVRRRAHAHDMRAVAWYLPSLGRPARDRSRSLAAVRYRTPDGQRFHAFALDIQAATVADVSLRSRRAVGPGGGAARRPPAAATRWEPSCRAGGPAAQPRLLAPVPVPPPAPPVRRVPADGRPGGRRRPA
jgi:hypothetical protein